MTKYKRAIRSIENDLRSYKIMRDMRMRVQYDIESMIKELEEAIDILRKVEG